MFFNPYFLVTLYAAFSLAPAESNEVMPLDELLQHKRITIQAKGKGGYSGETIEAMVRNTSGGTIRASIPAGWVFQSVNEGVQDLMVVRDEEFVLASGSSRSISCKAFCVQGQLSGPKNGEAFRAGGMGRKGLVGVARGVASGDYPDHVVQSALWVMSDGYSIAAMGPMDSSAVDTLRLLVSRLSGQPPPLYKMFFEEQEGQVCTGRPRAILRDFSFNIPVSTELTAVVLNASGRIVHTFESRTVLDPGRHARRFEVPVLGWPKGRYAIHVYTSIGPGVHRMPFDL